MESPKNESSIVARTAQGGFVDIEVSVVTGRGLKNPHKFRRHPIFSVELTLDNETKSTDAKHSKDDAVMWNSTFLFSAAVASSLKIRVYCRHRHSDNHKVGEASIEVLNTERNKDIEIELHAPGNSTREMPSSAFLTLHLKAALSVLFKIESDSAMDFRSASFLKQMEGVVGSGSSHNFEELSPTWIRLFTSLKTFSSLAQAVAELDSRAKVAVGAVTFAIKVLVDQIIRDEKIDNLGRTMCELYAYVIDTCSVRKITSFEKTLQRLLAQTAECAYFIADYRRISVFTQRAVVNLMSNADSMILNFEAAFGELKIALILGSSLQTTLVSYRILQTVEHIVDRMLIDRLPILEDVSWDSEKTCLRGTRETTVNGILHWASGNHGDMSSSSRVYLLSGPIACGKSTVTHSIAKIFHEQNRLGAAIFLHDEVPGANSKRISSTIIHQLTGYDPSLHARIAAKIKADQSLIWADIKRQFRALMVETTESTNNKLLMIGPVLVVIDGLDRVDAEEQLKTLTAIAEHSGSLPPNFRILLTCRNDNIVVQKVQRRLIGHVHDIGFDDTGSDSKTSISQLLSQSLSDMFSKNFNLSIQYQLDEMQAQLEKRSRGMHFWVSTLCRSLLECENDDASLLLTLLLSGTFPLSNEDAMDHLYHALFKVFFCHQPGVQLFFHALIQSPQLMSSAHMRQFDFLPLDRVKEGTDADTAQTLGLIIEMDKDEQGVSLFGVHPTLEDFLTNPHRCYGSGVYVDRGTPLVRSTADLCLNIMNQSLRYNICNIEDVTVMVIEIPDKDSRVEHYISKPLQYACCHWTLDLDALEDGFEDKTLFQNLRVFIPTHILHWIEIMTLLGHFNDIGPTLLRFLRWLQERKIKRSDVLYALTADAIHFVNTFSAMISIAVLQTYTSALQLMPSHSMLFHHFSKRVITDGFDLKFANDYKWNVEQLLFGHDVSCCCSADGSLIAAGSNNGVVSLWDAGTGIRVGCSITVYSEVQSLTFSPNGACLAIVTDIGQVTVNDVQTGKCVYSISTNINDASITYSNDGTAILIVGRPWDYSQALKCCVCDALTGDLRLSKTFTTMQDPKSPSDIALSPDGQKLAILTEIGIQLFEIDTGKTIDVNATYSCKLHWNELHRCFITWSPDAAFIGIASAGEGTVSVLSLHDGRCWSIDVDNMGFAKPSALSFSSDSSRIAFAWFYRNNNGNFVLRTQIWVTITTKQIGNYTFNEGPILYHSRQLSFLPSGREIIVLSTRCDEAWKTFVHRLSDTSPAYMTVPPTFCDFKAVPTISFSFSSERPSYEYASTVDGHGWIVDVEGKRIILSPYPNFDICTRPDPSSTTSVLVDIKHPESKKTVLMYVFEWGQEVNS